MSLLPEQSFPASVPDAAGVNYAWVVTNGAITAGIGTHQTTVVVGESGPVTVAVTETDVVTGCVLRGSISIPVGILATRFYTVTPCRLSTPQRDRGCGCCASSGPGADPNIYGGNAVLV